MSRLFQLAWILGEKGELLLLELLVLAPCFFCLLLLRSWLVIAIP